MRKTEKKITERGRPTVMTKEVIDKLEMAFKIGATDVEACAFAEISDKTLYNYQEAFPEFLQRKQELKALPILKAKQTIVNGLSDPLNAKWYLERKAKDEFGTTRQEITGANGKDLIPPSKVLNISPNMSIEQIRALGESIGALGEGYDLDV
jgi:hypothetical protein